MNFSYVCYISTSGITTLHTQDIFLEKIKNHANSLIGDLMHLLSSFLYSLTTSASASLFELTAGLASALPSPLSLHLQQLGSGGFSLFSSYGNTWGE